MEEVWAEIEGFPNYMVSTFGRVYNSSTHVYLKGRPTQQGYLRVVIAGKDQYIAQLVAKAFFGAFRHGMHVSHVNGDKNNNSTVNLRLRAGMRRVDDNRENHREWGRRVRIVETGEVFRTVRDCANYIGGDYGSIYAVLRGKRNHHQGFTFEYYEENN